MARFGKPRPWPLAKRDGDVQQIVEARGKTGDLISRLMLTYAGFAAFCFFALLARRLIAPDSTADRDAIAAALRRLATSDASDRIRRLYG